MLQRAYIQLFRIMVASIKNIGNRPCTRCSIPLEEVSRLGMKGDRRNRERLARFDDSDRRTRVEIARNAIYNANLSITHDEVSNQLDGLSLVPTDNAFSDRLSPLDFNLFDILVSDVLHECAIPVFEGLLPHPHNQRILKLIFTLAHWHGLAKLRMQTDHTLHLLDNLTTDLGKRFRGFVTYTCDMVETKELAREHAARMRKELKQKKTILAKGTKRQKVGHVADGGRKAKKFSLKTYKFHALGHIVLNIKRFGTSDNYSTQLLVPSKAEGPLDTLRTLPYFIGKSQHKPVDLTEFLSKHRDDIATQKFLAKLKLHLLPRIRRTMLEEAQANPDNYRTAISVLQRLVAQSDESEEHIMNESDRIFFHSNRIYGHQILQINYTTYDLRREQDTLNPSTSRCHIMCLNDAESSASPNSPRFSYGRVLGIFHANVAFFGEGTLDRRPRRFDFLWIRWFKELGGQEPWSACQLDRVAFPPLKNLGSVDFLDPRDVLRACHIIPRFSTGLVHSPSTPKDLSKSGKNLTGKATSTKNPTNAEKQSTGGKPTSKGKGKRPARAKQLQFPAVHTKAPLSPLAKDDADWKEYYINRFVDRDMIMRYHWGLGVGHRYSHTDAPIENPYGGAVSTEDDQNSGDSDSEIFDDDKNEDSGVQEADSLEVSQALNADIEIDEEANLRDGEVPADYIGYDHRPDGSPHDRDTQLDLQTYPIEEAGELGTEGYDSDASIYGLHDRQEELPDDSGDEDEDDMYVEDCDIPEADSESDEDA
ncbi:hypothetical protein H1R20_g4136, partial [Candolleomyces eurysporus]